MDPFLRRNAIIAAFRRKVYAHHDIIWYPHQAEWQLASEGFTLQPCAPTDPILTTYVLIPDDQLAVGETVVATKRINDQPCSIVTRAVAPRLGGVAHHLIDLAGYKGGKSYGGALWLSGFAAIPGKINIVGLEYSTSEPEFEYLTTFLLSESNGRPPIFKRATKLLNDRRQGRMLLELPTGASFEVKSWERKEALKGKKILCYYYAEAYQLPGFECYTTVAQNLRELRGFACFTTTPDKPWVGALHDLGHGHDPDWHCTCEVDSRCNPYTFDQRARDRDDPEKNGIMTRERFAIAWEGKLGHFVGRVYDVNRSARTFSPLTFPEMWSESLRTSVEAIRAREQAERAILPAEGIEGVADETLA